MTRYFERLDDCLDSAITTLGQELVLAIPLGIGKPNPLVNALYQRAKADQGLSLKILTALSLSRPKASSELEKAFLDPFVERVFGNYPDLDYDIDLRTGLLPPNVQVHEFFLKSGDYLKNDYAQQQYMSSNYTHVARDLMIQGVNLVAQAVAVRERQGRTEYSLSCNPEITLDLLPLLRGCGRPVYRVLVVNRELPFMENDAIVDLNEVDAVVTDPAGTHTVFSAPNMKVALSDYSIGLYASSLVSDGGTLQIGIGSLGDAIAQALILRHRHSADYQRLMQAQGIKSPALAPFQQGLYGCSEMFVNGFMQLIKADVIKREVYADLALQTLINQGRIGREPSLDTVLALWQAGRIQSPLRTEDIRFLKRYGIFKDDIPENSEELVLGYRVQRNDLSHPETLEAIKNFALGSRLKGGIIMHGGFFLGPRDFYQALRELNDEMRARINMTAIGFINQLYGQEALGRAQRRDARLFNTCMMMTLMGAAVSDGLDSGRLVSGVGGQYNFVAMAHALPDARSIIMLRATRQSGGETMSNIVWNYAHTTIPRHLRDIVITEYGIADLRGQSDSEVIKRLLNITDSRFQTALLVQAKDAGKLEQDYNIPESRMNNLPETLKDRLAWAQKSGLLPDFPFGTDFTGEELEIIKILQRMKESSEHPLQLLKALVASVREEKTVPEAWLERLQLDNPDNWKQKLLRQLFIGNV